MTIGQRGEQAATLRLRAVNHGLFGIVPAIFTAGLLYLFLRGNAHLFASDFHRSYWPAARRVLDGASPYMAPGLLDVRRSAGFGYPAVGALLIAPFGLLPRFAAEVVFTTLNFVALPVAMRLLGVRDWRAYGLVLLWLPVVAAWETANLTLLLLLGIAVVWRYRDRPLVAGLMVALMVSAKPITWPLLLWLLASRRYRSLAWTAGCGLALNAVAWSIVGFGELHRFVALMQTFADKSERLGYTIVSLALHLHVPSGAALALGLAPGVAAAAACVLAGRAGRERVAMVLCIAVVLFATSVVWLHYFTLLIIPLALMRPRLSAAWALPALMWVCLPTDDPAAWQIAVSLIASGAVIATCLRPAGVRAHRTRAQPALAGGLASPKLAAEPAD